MGQTANPRGSSIIADISDLVQRIWALERRLERQERAMNRALNRAEREREELNARIRILEKELNRQSR